MKILMLENNLNGHSGTPKYLIKIAEAFLEHGDDVNIIFFSESSDSENIKYMLKKFSYKIIKERKSILYYLQLAMIKLFESRNFNENDIGGLLNQLETLKYVKRNKPDIVIAINIFSALSFIFLPKGCCKKLVYLHEAPLFEEFFSLLKLSLRFYTRIIHNKSDYFISMSESTYHESNKIGIKSIPLSFIFLDSNIKHFEKEKIILMDTRWTAERNVFFSIKIIKKLRDMKFIVAGYFPDEEIRGKYLEILNSEKLNERVQIVENFTEDHLNELYKKSKYVIRWGGFHENGPSVSIIKGISYYCIPIVSENLGSSKFIRENISPELVVSMKEENFAEIIDKIEKDRDKYNQLISKIENIHIKYSNESYINDLLEVIYHNDTNAV